MAVLPGDESLVQTWYQNIEVALSLSDKLAVSVVDSRKIKVLTTQKLQLQQHQHQFQLWHQRKDHLTKI